LGFETSLNIMIMSSGLKMLIEPASSSRARCWFSDKSMVGVFMFEDVRIRLCDGEGEEERVLLELEQLQFR
jgi:hypothetical protein